MPSNEIDRKIAVIFATDVVNYSKHMEKDEGETVKSLKYSSSSARQCKFKLCPGTNIFERL